MADINLKTETPDTSLPTTGFLFGADSQAAASPSVYSTQTVATTLLGSTTLSGATITADAPVLNMSQTWNNGAVTFTGLKFNAAGTSDANSAAASLLMDLQVGGASRFSVSKAGALLGPNATFEMRSFSTNAINFFINSNRFFGLDQGDGFRLASGMLVCWTSSGTDVNVTRDLFIGRRAAANLRLGAADAAAPVAQTLSVQSGTAGASATTVSISGTALTIAGTITGTIAIGHAVTGTGVSAGTLITAGSGSSWTVNNSQTVGPITAYFNSVGQNLTITGSQGSGPSAGGSIIFQVAPAGSAATTAQNALSTALTIDSTRRATFAARLDHNGAVALFTNGGFGQYNGSANFEVNQSIGFAPGSIISGGIDTYLLRDAANTLALRNGANAQAFRVYNTTDGTNSESLNAYWAGNTAYLLTVGVGTGPSRNLVVGTAANNASLAFWTNAAERWSIGGSTGHLLAATDNTYDIGASGATRPRNLFLGSYAQLSEMTAPAAPAANGVRIYAVDNGSGKTQLMALFATGAAQQIAIEP